MCLPLTGKILTISTFQSSNECQERDGLMVKTQDWRMNRQRSGFWHKFEANNLLSPWLNACNKRKKKKKKVCGSLLSVANIFWDCLWSIEIIFFWKHFRKKQRQWGGFLYVWRFIQNFLRHSKLFQLAVRKGCFFQGISFTIRLLFEHSCII